MITTDQYIFIGGMLLVYLLGVWSIDKFIYLFFRRN